MITLSDLWSIPRGLKLAQAMWTVAAAGGTERGIVDPLVVTKALMLCSSTASEWFSLGRFRELPIAMRHPPTDLAARPLQIS